MESGLEYVVLMHSSLKTGAKILFKDAHWDTFESGAHFKYHRPTFQAKKKFFVTFYQYFSRANSKRVLNRKHHAAAAT